MKEIKMSWIAKINKFLVEIFEAEDEDYPDYRSIRPKERAIDRYLNLITNDKIEQRKIIDAINKETFNVRDTTFKPICDNLRALGYIIKEGE